MLLKRIVKTALKPGARYFAGGSVPEDPNIREKLTQEEQDKLVRYNYFERHQTPPDHKAIWQYLSSLSKNNQEMLATWFTSNYDNVKETRVDDDVYNPPKLNENSLFLYQSEKLATSFRTGKMLEYPAYTIIFLIAPTPLTFLFGVGIVYTIASRAAFYEPVNRLVVRMDLLPEEEMINFQKIGLMGRIINRQVRISDLEKINKEDLKENYFDYFNDQTMDKDLIFKNKLNGELFMFDKDGYWDWKNLGHELIY